MIGVDTNVLLRSLVHDDPVQGRRVTLLAERIARAEDNLFVDDVVLCETVWTLRTGFRLSRERIAEVLEDLIETALFVFEDRNLLREALRAYRAGSADFADYLIGLRNARAGCDHTVTFDRALRHTRPSHSSERQCCIESAPTACDVQRPRIFERWQKLRKKAVPRSPTPLVRRSGPTCSSR